MSECAKKMISQRKQRKELQHEENSPMQDLSNFTNKDGITLTLINY